MGSPPIGDDVLAVRADRRFSEDEEVETRKRRVAELVPPPARVGLLIRIDEAAADVRVEQAAGAGVAYYAQLRRHVVIFSVADAVAGVSQLAVGLPLEHLTKPVRVVLAEESDRGEIIARATDLRGKVIRCRVPCTSLVDAAKARVGVILLMEEWRKKQVKTVERRTEA